MPGVLAVYGPSHGRLWAMPAPPQRGRCWPRLVLIALTGGINVEGPSMAHSLGYVIYCDLDYGRTSGPKIVAGGDSRQRRAVRAIYPEHCDANNSTSRISLSYSTDLGTRAGRSPLVCVVTKGNLLRFRPSGPRQRALAILLSATLDLHVCRGSGTSDNLDQFAGNHGLSGSVEENLVLVDHLAGVLGGILQDRLASR